VTLIHELSMLTHEQNCILLLNCKFTLPKCNTKNSTFVGLQVSAIGKKAF
jgi:hypothetical protein